MVKVEYTISEFHQLIWTRSLTRLSEDWDIPYKDLKELCSQLNIPRPGNSYWANLNLGKNPPIDPLPESPDSSTRINFDQLREALRPKPKIVIEPVLKEVKPKIAVVKRSTATDPLVKATKEHYLNGKHYWHDRNCPAFIHIDVAKENLNRALTIAEVFVATLRSLGYDFCRRNDDLCLVKRGVEIPFKIHEKLRRESKMVKGYPESEYVQTGILAIKFKIHYDWKAQAETELVKLEDKLPHIFEYIEKKIDEGYEYRQELERGWAKQREENQKREEEKLRRENELVKFHDLFKMSDRFYKAQHIRDYVAHVEERAIRTSALTDELKDWIQWAKDKADWLDPFVNKEDELLKDGDIEKCLNNLTR